MKTFKKTFMPLVLILGFLLINKIAFAHCEVPCGIYDDSVRITLIKEHITTVEKSMKLIIELSAESSPNYNQLVRWVMNKEEHASRIQEIVSQYFLHQRIKFTDPADKEKYQKYLSQLELLHKLQVYSMKSKQSTDLANIEQLRKTVAAFEESYFKGHKH
ncbi:superoxide dismutase [Ni] [Bacteroidota bacterium]